MSETLLRHWNTLALIPPSPRKITAEHILRELESEGFKTTLRTVQRDLHMLSRLFPIQLDDRDKPFGWSWMRDAQAYSLPGMTPSVALSMQLAHRFLEPLFPKHQFDVLSAYFSQAETVLNKADRNFLQKWNNKVSIVPRGLQLQPASVSPEVLEVVYDGLLYERIIEMNYFSRSSGESKHFRVKPLGIAYRDSISYLVARINDYDNETLLSLHRIEQAELTEDTFEYPSDFKLNDYLNQGKLGYLQSESNVALKLKISRKSGFHLIETPLAEDQTIVEHDDFYEVCATVKDTSEVRWWIMGMGSHVEVLAPQALRESIREDLAKALQQYC